MGAAYRDRLCRYAADEWTLMPIDGRNAIIEHMQVLTRLSSPDLCLHV